MRRRLAGAAAACAAALALAGASNASAASEIGSNCSADGGAATYTLMQLAKDPANPLPLEAPTSGVITQWKVNLGLPIPGYSERLKVLRPTATTNQFQVVGESELKAISPGLNVVPSRIPVQAGDRLGASAVGEKQAAFYCKAGAGAVMGAVLGDGPVGSTQTFAPVAEGFQVALAAVIEPDADNDGFGDETQDKCPQSAAVQVECPVVVLDSFALAKKSSIVVLVSTDESAPVTVSGTVQLPKGAKKASASAKAKLKKVTHNVPAGKLVRFTLKFPGSLKAALRSLPHGKSLTVKLEATSKNVAGQVSKDKSKLKLKG